MDGDRGIDVFDVHGDVDDGGEFDAEQFVGGEWDGGVVWDCAGGGGESGDGIAAGCDDECAGGELFGSVQVYCDGGVDEFFDGECAGRGEWDGGGGVGGGSSGVFLSVSNSLAFNGPVLIHGGSNISISAAGLSGSGLITRDNVPMTIDLASSGALSGAQLTAGFVEAGDTVILSANNIVGLNNVNPAANYLTDVNFSFGQPIAEGSGINLNGGQLTFSGARGLNMGQTSLGDSTLRVGSLGATIAVDGFSMNTAIRVPVIAQGPVTIVEAGSGPFQGAVLLENAGNQLGNVTVASNMTLAASQASALNGATVTLNNNAGLLVLANSTFGPFSPPVTYNIVLNVVGNSTIDNNPHSAVLGGISTDISLFQQGAVLLPVVNIGDAFLGMTSSSVSIGTLNLVGNAALFVNGNNVGNITQDSGQRSLSIGGSGVNSPAVIVTGALSATAPITVSTGGIEFDGTSSPSSSPVTVGRLGSLFGNGTLHRPVVFTDSSLHILSPGSGMTVVGTLALDSLVLGNNTNMEWDLGTPGVLGGATNDLLVVGGDLTLDGKLTLNHAAPAGEYTLITYGGVLTDEGLTVPAGDSVDLSVAGEVRLVVTAVPEAGTVGALGVGVAVMGWRRRGRRV